MTINCDKCASTNLVKCGYIGKASDQAYLCKDCGRRFAPPPKKEISDKEVDNILREFILDVYNRAIKLKRNLSDPNTRNAQCGTIKDKVINLGKTEADYEAIYKPLFVSLCEDKDIPEEATFDSSLIKTLNQEKEMLDKEKKALIDFIEEYNLDILDSVQAVTKIFVLLEVYHKRILECLKKIDSHGANYTALIKLDRRLIETSMEIIGMKTDVYDLLLPKIRFFMQFFDIYRENALILLGDAGYETDQDFASTGAH